MLLNRVVIICCRLTSGRPFYSNDVILLNQGTGPLYQGMVPLFGLHQIQSNDMTLNCISSETHIWYMYQTWEIETPNLGFTQMASQGGVGGQNILLILAPMCFFVEQPVVSLLLYNRAIQWLMEAGWEGHLKMPLPFENIGQYYFTQNQQYCPLVICL